MSIDTTSNVTSGSKEQPELLTAGITSGQEPTDNSEDEPAWYLESWMKFAVFNGRSSRQEYWTFVLVNYFFMFVFGIVGVFSTDKGFLLEMFILAQTIPHLAITARRLHDTSRSGWLAVFGLIPLGGLLLLPFMLLKGNQGSNIYGDDPTCAMT